MSRGRVRRRERAGIGHRNDDSGLTAGEAARIAYRETMRGTPIVVPGLGTRIFALVTRHLPARMVPGLVRYVNRRRGQDEL